MDKDDYQLQDLAERLRTARLKRNLSQSEASLKAGLDRKICSHIESGKGAGNTGVLTLTKLAQALGVAAGWLAFGEHDSGSGPDDLLSELAEVKEQRRALAAKQRDDSDDEDDEDEDDADDEVDDDDGPRGLQAAQRQRLLAARSENPAWPLGYRPTGLVYHHLPSLGRHYAPVIEALGPKLPQHRREEVGQMLMLMLTGDEERELQQEKAHDLNELLLHMVPEKDRVAVRLVMADLNSDDWTIRGKIALSLIIDGGLPVDFDQMLLTRRGDLPQELDDALDDGLEILENATTQLRSPSLLMPPSHGENFPQSGP